MDNIKDWTWVSAVRTDGVAIQGTLLPTGQPMEGWRERTVRLRGMDWFVKADSVVPIKHTSQGAALDMPQGKRTVRAEVLDEAKRITATDRNSSYGEPEDNFQRIADLWNVFLQDKLKDGAKITAGDTAALAIMIKLAREMNAPKKDNKVDIAGYAACWAEVDAE